MAIVVVINHVAIVFKWPTPNVAEMHENQMRKKWWMLFVAMSFTYMSCNSFSRLVAQISMKGIDFYVKHLFKLGTS